MAAAEKSLFILLSRHGELQGSPREIGFSRFLSSLKLMSSSWLPSRQSISRRAETKAQVRASSSAVSF